MRLSSLSFEREYEFAPLIVWDALVDAELVSGWLAEATITAERGGHYILRWLNRDVPAFSAGVITVFQPGRELEVSYPATGSLYFRLEERAGGHRGTSTFLSVEMTAAIESVFAARVKADWITNLDQLDDLLRGHPVDWGNGERDHHQTWVEHLGAVDSRASQKGPQ
ncbi:MAG: SRPBCC domain-containing protein [Rhodoglobus sp.]